MKISVSVKPNAKREEVTKMPDGSYRVSVNAPPVKGRANEAVIERLADYFSVPKSAISIVRGVLGKKKVVLINGSSWN